MILVRVDSAASAVRSQYQGIGRLLGEFDPALVNGFIGETVDSSIADTLREQLGSKGIEATVSVVETDEGLVSSASLLKMGVAILIGIGIGYLVAKKG